MSKCVRIARRILEQQKFLILILHFVNQERGEDRKVAKILPVINYLIDKLKMSTRLAVKLASMNCWVQCIRTRAARFGIKSYELCEAFGGFVVKMLIYTGKRLPLLAPFFALLQLPPRRCFCCLKIIEIRDIPYLWIFYTIMLY